jgi:D-serine deaminase-like pyridoxal phosphate-dependent protein
LNCIDMNWYEINSPEKVLSPALLFYPDRIQSNIDSMIRIAGSVERLRPHVKTYKCPEIVRMQMAAGIDKFKCATLQEATMLAGSGVKDILIAYPLVGPAQSQLPKLQSTFPETTFSVLVDHEDTISSWKSILDAPLDVYIDVDVGMHRTGISPIKALELREQLDEQFNFKGWHLYDGHIREKDATERARITTEGYERAKEILNFLPADDVICGGSITFSIHALDPERTLSPGTTLLWDHGYGSTFPDIPMINAATLLMRIVSKPDVNMLCLDLGHKAVGSETKGVPVFFPELREWEIVVHSEEHLTIRTPEADKWHIGDVLFGLPWHICPTVALHEQAAIVKEGNVIEFWTIEARKRLYQP